MPDDPFRELFIKKQLVIDVCEPFIQTLTVAFRDFTFSLQRFGSFEFDGDEYVYGCEESTYADAFDKDKISELPIVFAIVSKDKSGDSVYTLYPAGMFDSQEIEIILEEIEYTLESQRVASHYLTRCYD